MVWYDQKTVLTGVTADLARKKLNLAEDALIEVGEYTWDSGYCETCSYTEYEFAILADGTEVFDTRTEALYFSGSVFAAFNEWLNS